MGSPPAYYSNTPSPQEPTAQPPQVQLFCMLQGVKLSTSGGGSGGDAPTHWAGEENLPKGEEDPSRPKAQVRGPVIGVPLGSCHQVNPQEFEKTQSSQFQKHWDVCSVLSFLKPLTLSQIINECSQRRFEKSAITCSTSCW